MVEALLLSLRPAWADLGAWVYGFAQGWGLGALFGVLAWELLRLALLLFERWLDGRREGKQDAAA